MVAAQIFFYACLAFAAGVGIASLISVSRILLFAGAALAALLFVGGLVLRRHLVAVCGILLVSFVAGFWRFDAGWQKTVDNDLIKIISAGREMEVNGVIINDPVLGLDSQQLVLRARANEKILVIAGRYPEYHYGDRIKFAARLEAPQNFDSFDYKNYLAKDSIFAMARYPEIELVARGLGNPVYASLFWVKSKLKQGIGQSLPSPQNSLLTAILLGDQSGLSSCSDKETEADPACMKLKEKLNISGLRHLAAVSGTHVTIMAQIIAPFLIWLGWWRQKALWAAIAFVWLFVLMIGLPASAVRAAIMGSLIIFARIIGRDGDSLRLVVVAAALMVWHNPMVLRFDIGFQLSFLAVLGMVFFSMPVGRILKFIPENFDFLRQGLAVTFAAQLFTLPVLVYDFGYFSPYGLPANLLAEPFVPFITIYGFLFVAAAAVSFSVGWLLFFPIWLALSYLLVVANLFSQLPGARIDFYIDIFWVLLSYFVLGFIAWRVKERERFYFLK